MHVHHEGLEVRTHGKGLYEITEGVHSKIDKCGIQNGTVTVFVQHTSCSIVIMEMPIQPRDATWKSFSTASCRKTPITSRTILRAATTCHHTSGWS